MARFRSRFVDLLQFELSFAGVPFWSDDPARIGAAAADSPAEYARDPDLLAEVDRLLPFHYLQEQRTSSAYPGRNLGAVAHPWQPGHDRPPPDVRVGDFFYPTGCRRWGVFRGLATTSTAKAMLQATEGRLKKTFTMRAFPLAPSHLGNHNTVTAYTVETDMYLLPPRPLAEHGGRFEGLYLITLVDERYWWQSFPVSLGPNRYSTWPGLLDEIADALNIVLNYAEVPGCYGTPCPDSQLWTNAENAALLLEAVARNLGRTVVRKLEGDYALLTPLQSQAIANANRGRRVPGNEKTGGDQFVSDFLCRTAGGDIFESGVILPKPPVRNIFPDRLFQLSRNATVPATVRVCFPKYVHGDDPVPHFLNPKTTWRSPQADTSWFQESHGDTYNVDVPILSGGGVPLSGHAALTSGNVVSGVLGVSGFTHAVRTTAKALLSGDANTVPVNLSGITSMALALAHDFWAPLVMTPALDEAYPGTFAWEPEGFHDICWTYSPRSRQAVTRTLRAPWNERATEFQHAAPALAKETPVARGRGGPLVAQTWTDWLSGVDVTATLTGTLASGQLTAVLGGVGLLPTQNRWRGLLSGPLASGDGFEVVLFEGTGGYVSSGLQVSGTVQSGQPIASGLINSSGTLTSGAVVSGGGRLNVVYRAVEGNQPLAWPVGTTVRLVKPDTAYGVNKVGFGRMQWAYPHEWTSGGVTGIQVVPQTQSVLAKAGGTSGFVEIKGLRHYSGEVWSYDEAKVGQTPWTKHENCWLVPRDNETLTEGRTYDGQFAGYSLPLEGASGGGQLSGGPLSGTAGVAPVYLVTEYDVSGASSSSGTDCSGVMECLSGLLGCGRNWVDLFTAERFSGVCVVQWDSTPTAYNPDLGDVVMTRSQDTLTIRLNGATAIYDFYRYRCMTSGPFSGRIEELRADGDWRNGLLKVRSGTYEPFP